MSDNRQRPDGDDNGRAGGRLMGSLRDALAAAGREDQTAKPPPVPAPAVPALPPPAVEGRTMVVASKAEPASPSAAEAARDARGGGRAASRGEEDRHVEVGGPTTRIVRAPHRAAALEPGRTQLIRGKTAVKRTEFFQDPVVGWLVVVGGPGLGAFRPIFEGNNTVGRGAGQRIPIDFGDDTISSEEQAYIRYDSADRKFLLVPNLAKTNVVAVNDRKPTGAVELAGMDLITMGRTQLVFVPFCGNDFDWAELSELK